ncbi:hypothetical protein F0562_019616 [Nyssa sinensis]|uniref:Peptidase A1 domain-containing protein n=1 Tax=Nyssa sinensis TaxID=561372 RepID=A0A5J5BSV7_9ASTE|nr:hypothetical protein F0562_019616 [Nyssa sinensis]
MGLVLFLIFSTLLAKACSFAEYQKDEQLGLKHAPLHLSLYHVLGPGPLLSSQSPISFFEVLAQDEARVRSITSRIANNKLNKSGSSNPANFNSSYISLNPGFSIGVGNYYVNVGLGTPAKYYPMVVDTGSSFSWLQCQPCSVYCHKQVGPLFNPSASNTYKSLSCTTSQCYSLKEATLNDPFCKSNVCIYTASYGDQSFSQGYLSQDLLSLTPPSQTLPAFVFGCGQNNQGLFGQTAGLIGLARHKLSMLAQLSTKYGYAFSYCLPTSGGSGGSLSIGSTSLISSPSSAYKFTPMITDSHDRSLYFLRLAAITVAGKPIVVAVSQYSVPTILDSGTTITRLPMSIYTALRQAFVKIMMSSNYQMAPPYSILDACFKGSLKEMSAVPKVGMIFQGGADLTLAPHNILFDVDKGITCLAFATNSATGGVAIIGNHQQQTYKVGYDVSNSRIGFAAGGCH